MRCLLVSVVICKGIRENKCRFDFLLRLSKNLINLMNLGQMTINHEKGESADNYNLTFLFSPYNVAKNKLNKG